ncbi:MAG: hypothetical protein AABZ13_02190 [Planctomycetota bacterium]
MPEKNFCSYFVPTELIPFRCLSSINILSLRDTKKTGEFIQFLAISKQSAGEVKSLKILSLIIAITRQFR